jgi:hypothetical protein
MSMNRRTMLKGVVLSSAVSTLASCQQRVARSGPGISPATASSDGSCFVNLLLHGGFFVDFQQTGIVVKAPAVLMHKYAIGSQGFLTELYKPAAQPRLPATIPPPTDIAVDMDWTTLISGLAAGAVKSFGDYPAIPQFSATDTKVGNMNGPYRWQIALPFPKEVIPLRLGKLCDFKHATKNGRVKESVMNLCSKNGNDKLALIICLRYQKRPEYCAGSPAATTYGLHADHQCEPSTAEINDTLKQMATVFEHPENFDLQVTDADVPGVPRDIDKREKGITEADEKSIAEILSPVPFATNCSSHGIVATASRVKSCLPIGGGGCISC